MAITKTKLKTFAKTTGIVATPIAILLVLYLVSTNLITVTWNSGDMSCAGTINDPCFAIINFTANSDISISKIDDKGFFYTDNPIKSAKLIDLKANKEINFSKTNTLKKGQSYSWMIVAYKNNPFDRVKWGFNEIDPYWDPAGSLNTDLFAWWKMDETTGTIMEDAINGTHNGTYFNNTLGQAGIINYSAYFTKDQQTFANVSDNPAFNTNTFTYSLWINVTNNDTGYQKIIQRYGSDGDGYTIEYNLIAPDGITNGISISAYKNFTSTSNYFVLESDNIIDMYVWNHIVLRLFDNGTMDFWINGIKQANSNNFSSNDPIISLSELIIGRNIAIVNSHYFDGDIDEIGYWNRSLTDSEIAYLYNGGNGTTYGESSGDMIFPEISIVYPVNATYSSVNELNYTFIEENPDSCWIQNSSFEYVNQSDGFAFSKFGATNNFGIWGNNSNFWFADTGTNSIYYTDLEGNLISSFASHEPDPLGICGNDSDLWIVDQTEHVNNNVSHSSIDGTEIDSFIVSPASYSPRGMYCNDSDLWINHVQQSLISHYSINGTFIDSFNTTQYNSGELQGLSGNGTDFFIGSNSSNVVIHTDSNGNEIDKIDLSNLGISYARNMWFNNSDFWITDTTDLFVYHIAKVNFNTVVSMGENFTGLTSNPGENTWNLYCNDTSNNINSTSVTFDILSYDLTQSPANDTSYNLLNNTFECNITLYSTENLTNASVYIYEDGNLINTASEEVTGLSNSSTFSLDIYSGNHSWFCSFLTTSFEINGSSYDLFNPENVFIGYTNSSAKFIFRNNKINASEPDGQTETQGFFNVTNYNVQNITVYSSVNYTVPEVYFRAGNDSDYNISIYLDTTNQTLISNLTGEDYNYIWFWADFVNYSGSGFRYAPELTLDYIKL
jgi:hypothetical protein